jgi:hypothetical protein
MLKQWLEKRRQTAYDRAYRSGYDWAAGSLLRGDHTPLGVEGVTYPPDGPFNLGASAATDRLVEVGAVEDDRLNLVGWHFRNLHETP